MRQRSFPWRELRAATARRPLARVSAACGGRRLVPGHGGPGRAGRRCPHSAPRPAGCWRRVDRRGAVACSSRPLPGAAVADPAALRRAAQPRPPLTRRAGSRPSHPMIRGAAQRSHQLPRLATTSDRRGSTRICTSAAGTFVRGASGSPPPRSRPATACRCARGWAHQASTCCVSAARASPAGASRAPGADNPTRAAPRAAPRTRSPAHPCTPTSSARARCRAAPGDPLVRAAGPRLQPAGPHPARGRPRAGRGPAQRARQNRPHPAGHRPRHRPAPWPWPSPRLPRPASEPGPLPAGRAHTSSSASTRRTRWRAIARFARARSRTR